MCQHDFFDLGWCEVCKLCGVQRAKLTLDRYNTHSFLTTTCYNRPLRFKTLAERVILGQNAPPGNDEVWKFLYSCPSFLSPKHIFDALQKSGLKNKHYDCLHIFSRYFCYKFEPVEENALTTFNTVMKEFRDIFHRWRYSTTDTFFSYLWLLRHLLEGMDSKYVKYLKPRTCQLRHDKYLNLLADIRQFRIQDGNLNCKSLAPRFQNEKLGGGIRRTLSHQPLCPDDLCSSGIGETDDGVVELGPYQKNMYDEGHDVSDQEDDTLSVLSEESQT